MLNNVYPIASLYRQIRESIPTGVTPLERQLLMKNKSLPAYLIWLLIVAAAASLLTAMSLPNSQPASNIAGALQVTVVSTIPAGVTPIVVVTGTAGVPVTGQQVPSTTWLFIAILIMAGLAFLVAVLALARRPYP